MSFETDPSVPSSMPAGSALPLPIEDTFAPATTPFIKPCWMRRTSNPARVSSMSRADLAGRQRRRLPRCVSARVGFLRRDGRHGPLQPPAIACPKAMQKPALSGSSVRCGRLEFRHPSCPTAQRGDRRGASRARGPAAAWLSRYGQSRPGTSRGNSYSMRSRATAIERPRRLRRPVVPSIGPTIVCRCSIGPASSIHPRGSSGPTGRWRARQR